MLQVSREKECHSPSFYSPGLEEGACGEGTRGGSQPPSCQPSRLVLQLGQAQQPPGVSPALTHCCVMEIVAHVL